MIIRVKYAKKDEVKYVGHLDTMRTFIRCIKRTNIPVQYSNGFNPRIQISFALPLGVGVTSESEYFDLALASKMNADMFIAELNSTLPDGFRILEVSYPEETKKSLMSLVKEAVYEIKINDEIDMDKLKSLFEEEKILIDKNCKGDKEDAHRDNHGSECNNNDVQRRGDYQSPVSQTDIKPNILDYKITDNVCTFHVNAGSVNNLNPNSIIEAINKYVGKVEDFDIHRKELII